MIGQTMNYRASIDAPKPIMPSQLPNGRIDYQGLIKYARSVGKTVMDLSDSEKDVYISGGTMKEIRQKRADY